MSENKIVASPLEQALSKVTRPDFGTTASPFDAGMAEVAAPEVEQRRARRATDIPEIDLSNYPISDADFARFEERFGIDPGQKTAFDNAFRIVRTKVLQAIGDRGGQVIGITSPTARNGKTVSSIHLARACARRSEQTVVLADFNLQRPLLAGYLDAREFRSGIGFFRGEGRIEDYLTKAEEGNLLLFLSDRATSQSAELLASARLKQALDSFRRVAPNTVVILNLPPVLGSDDVMTIMPELDGVVMVAAANETTFTEMEDAARVIPEEKILCAILNKAKSVSYAPSVD